MLSQTKVASNPITKSMFTALGNQTISEKVQSQWQLLDVTGSQCVDIGAAIGCITYRHWQAY